MVLSSFDRFLIFFLLQERFEIFFWFIFVDSELFRRMTDPNGDHEHHESDDENSSKYIPPAKKDLDEILQSDANDESLQR